MISPEVLQVNERAWSLWSLFDRQWVIAPLGGLIGWGGYDLAVKVLIDGYRVTGEELIGDLHRLKVCESSQMEIEAKRREEEEKKKKKPHQPNTSDIEHVEGDLSDFYDDEEDDEE